MSLLQRTILLLLVDIAAINVASALFVWMKFAGGALETVALSWQRTYPESSDGPSLWYALSYFSDVLLLICAIWLLLFFFYGLYRLPPSHSRFDEVLEIVKVATLGVLLAFIATFDQSDIRLTRFLIFFYWLGLLSFTAGGRVLVRSFERQLLLRGIGRRKTLIVGGDARGARLLNDLRMVPDSEFQVVGFVMAAGEEERSDVDGVPVLGDLSDLARLVHNERIEVVLIALQSNSHEEILGIVEAVDGQSVSFRITPDLYDIVTGHVRTTQIYGVPLMELKPELMPVWQQSVKRLIDVSVAVGILSLLSPLWLIIIVIIKLTSKGPVFFRQERVGVGGKPFTMYKFRSMRVDAEEKTGPVWVQGEDPRVTHIGKILRTLHLDEIPQCINFLKGDMSLVGPRPERPFFVDQFRQQIPLYMRRFNVKPGLLGWAQAKHEFDLDSKDFVGIARERLEYDLYYIENMTLKLDLKIMFQTVWFVLAGKSTR
ncbi:MAG: sugar transferase [Candidatus Latescibacterota bacterium]